MGLKIRNPDPKAFRSQGLNGIWLSHYAATLEPKLTVSSETKWLIRVIRTPGYPTQEDGT